jgi:hypothetical protein
MCCRSQLELQAFESAGGAPLANRRGDPRSGCDNPRYERPWPAACDDELDARIAHILGALWVAGSDEVVLLGSLEHGTFLVPRISGLEAAFRDFVTD